MHNQLVHPDGEHVLVEREAETASRIKDLVASDPYWIRKPRIHTGELHDLRLANKIDYAFLDLTGGITKDVAGWVENGLQHMLRPKARVAFTLAYGWRTNQYMYDMQSYIKEHDPKGLRRLSEALKIDKKPILVYVYVLRSIFSQWDFSLDQTVWYQDSQQSMLLFRLHDFVRRSATMKMADVGVKMQGVIGRCCGQAKKRSAAAHKAWETRRAEAAKRSQAAHKAWKTRRKLAKAH